MCEAKQRNYFIRHDSYFVGMLGVSKLIKSHVLVCSDVKIDHSGNTTYSTKCKGIQKHTNLKWLKGVPFLGQSHSSGFDMEPVRLLKTY